VSANRLLQSPPCCTAREGEDSAQKAEHLARGGVAFAGEMMAALVHLAIAHNLPAPLDAVRAALAEFDRR
jgi:hypothetical protein